MHIALTALASNLATTRHLTGEAWLQVSVIAAAAIGCSIGVNHLVRAIVRRIIGPGFAATISGRVVGYVTFLVGLSYTFNSLGIRVLPLLGALGLGGLVLALALQKLVENFVAGLMLQTRRPFTVGDTVTIGDHVGIVVDIDSRTTVLHGLDGTTIRIPNGNVMAGTIVNLTKGSKRRSTVDITVAYDTNLDDATTTLVDAVNSVTTIRHDPTPTILLSSIATSTIVYRAYYWHASDATSELTARHDVIAAAHRALTTAGIRPSSPQPTNLESPRDVHYATMPTGAQLQQHPERVPNPPHQTRTPLRILQRLRSNRATPPVSEPTRTIT